MAVPAANAGAIRRARGARPARLRSLAQQIKEPAQLDGWLRDGSAAYVDALCQWS